ncbi:MAG: class I SAM-dependent methyltransferase [Anaerolineales bacterium]|nr:class I SAM-dependent methyltransferase [Anaerolineales bacterium]
MENTNKNEYYFPLVEWEIKDIDSDGYILDLGGGGEGVIGQLKGKDVVAIDFRREELIEAADGPLKIVMDARELKFLDESFQTLTAFFSLMYIRKKEDQLHVFQEAWRVLKSGGTLHLWDIAIDKKPKTDSKYYIVHLKYQIGDKVTETGYGMVWPEESQGIDYYLDLAAQAGFNPGGPEWQGNTFYIRLVKD